MKKDTEKPIKDIGFKDEDDEEETVYRMVSIFSYIFVLVVVGLPVWWYTTRVYRATLPLSEMFDKELKEHTEKHFGIPLSLEYDILITFVNPDPVALNIDIEGRNIEVNLQSFLQNISSIADFKVKSQWLYFAELGAIPIKIDDHYALMEYQLPHVITPLEKKLWSHLTSRPCINFVLYFPHCQAPLYIYDKNNRKSKTNAFLSPRWGGIHIINPDKISCNDTLFEPHLESIVFTLITQLKHLLKMDGSNHEVYNLMKTKAENMLGSTRRTLKSLAQLLSEINSIVISDDVANKINVAVENADLAEKFLQANDIVNGLKHAKMAFENSEAAFSDPSLLALLYFPDDQKYAVYIPLFLPVMIPVLISLTTLQKWYKTRKSKKSKTD